MTLTPVELDIMKAVWRRSPATVKDVQAAIRPKRLLAYTTVMTVMNRLYLKGFLTRSLRSRAHHYEPAVAFAAAREESLNLLVDAFFEGSRAALAQYLNGGGSVEDVPEPSAETAKLDETLL